MRPTLAIIPLALLLSWFGPSPTGDFDRLGSLGLSPTQAAAPLTTPTAAQQVAEAWESIEWSGLLQANADLPQRR